MPSPWEFRKYGQSGMDVSTLFPKVGEMVDDLAFVRSMYALSNDHGPALFQMNTGSVLPGHVSWALFAELLLLAGFTAGWEATGSQPAGWAQFVLLAVLAAAMGVQASAVNEMGMANVSTTFLTGTLTGLVSSLVSPGTGTPYGRRRFGVLIGLATGAGLCGLLLATAAAVVPVLPLAALITALVLSAVPLRND